MRKRIREREEGDKGLGQVDLQLFHQLLEQRWLIARITVLSESAEKKFIGNNVPEPEII
jgi:hypothetical protein